MASDKIPNQSNNQDYQNFKIDIDKIYSDIIKEIDATRSVINVTNKNNQAILNALTTKKITSLRQSLKVEPTLQESRCHAFFRLIGFPVVGQDNFYNPGFNNVAMWWESYSNKTRTIDNFFKIQVTKTLRKGFRELSIFRETYLTDIAKIFSLNETIDASVLALTSSSATRKFAASSEKSGAFDFEETNQSYEVDLFKQGLVGDPNIYESGGYVTLLKYIDASGNSPTKLFSKHYHIIMPFMVDPWIDFTVCPNERLIAVPFVINKSNLRIGENAFVKRPLIEKVIRDRYAAASVDQNAGDYSQSIKDFVSQYIPGIKDSDFINSIIDKSKGIEQIQFREYLGIILEMVRLLYLNQQKITKAQIEYYWLPIPSKIGPEGGVTIRDFRRQISKKIIDAHLITPNDQDLLNAVTENAINRINYQLIGTSPEADIGDFALSPQKGFGPESTEAYGDINADVLDQLIKKRNSSLAEAGSALRTIEIIMGEFSGLGLCDIIAILGSLYVMPRDKILRFLDDDAFSRAKEALNLSVSLEDLPSIDETLESFTSTVKDFYNLMDNAYLYRASNNNRT